MLNSKMMDATKLTALEGKRMKNAITRSLVLLVLLLMIITMIASAIGEVSNSNGMNFVNDSDNVFTTDAKSTLIRVSQKMSEEYGMQIFISTFENLNRVDAKAMSKECFGEDTLGVLILLGTDENEVLIEVTDKIAEYVSSKKIESLIAEYATPNFAKKEYGNGMIEMQKWLINYIMSDIYPEVGQPLIKEGESIDILDTEQCENIDKITLETDLVLSEKSNSISAVLIVFLIIFVMAVGVFLKMRVLIKK